MEGRRRFSSSLIIELRTLYSIIWQDYRVDYWQDYWLDYRVDYWQEPWLDYWLDYWQDPWQDPWQDYRV